MNSTEIKTLLDKYFEGEANLEEEQALKAFFEKAQIPDEFQSYAHHFQFFTKLKANKPEGIVNDEALFANIEKESISNNTGEIKEFELHAGKNVISTNWFRYAAVITLLVLSFVSGMLVGTKRSASTESGIVTEAIPDNNRLLLTALDNKSSASERILAINESANTEDIDQEIANALIKTMNYDNNINVRLAAIEALSKFTEKKDVRSSIINSLELQDNPIIQIALIDLMVKVGEKSAINEFQRVIIDERTDEVVKQRAQAGLSLLM